MGKGVREAFAPQMAQPERDEALIRERLEIYRATIANNLREGFTQVPDQVREDPDLSRAAKLVYEQLLRYTRQKDCCWPSQQKIADDIVTISRRTVIRALKELYLRGYIEVWRRGLNRTNIYYINPLSFARSFKRTWRGRGVLVDAHAPELASVLNIPLPDVLTGLRLPVDPLSGKCQIDTTRSAKLTQPEVPNWHTKHTESNHTQREADTANESKIRRGEAAKLEKGTDWPNPTATCSHIERGAIGNEQSTDSRKTNGIGQIEASNQSNDEETRRPERAKNVEEDNKEEKKHTLGELAEEMGIAPDALTVLNAWMKENKRPQTTPIKLQGIIPLWSRELGNGENHLIAANITQASKLYRYARLNSVSQDATEQCFEDAREQVRLHAGVEKKMAYFFTSLKLEILMAIKRQVIPAWPAPQIPDGYEEESEPPCETQPTQNSGSIPDGREAQAEAVPQYQIIAENSQIGFSNAKDADWWAEHLLNEWDPWRTDLSYQVYPTQHEGRWGFVVRSQAGVTPLMHQEETLIFLASAEVKERFPIREKRERRR